MWRHGTGRGRAEGARLIGIGSALVVLVRLPGPLSVLTPPPSTIRAAEHDYAAAQEQAVDALTAAHVSVRDAAELLGLSYQRGAQIRPRPAAGGRQRRTSSQAQAS